MKTRFIIFALLLQTSFFCKSQQLYVYGTLISKTNIHEYKNFRGGLGMKVAYQFTKRLSVDFGGYTGSAKEPKTQFKNGNPFYTQYDKIHLYSLRTHALFTFLSWGENKLIAGPGLAFNYFKSTLFQMPEGFNPGIALFFAFESKPFQKLPLGIFLGVRGELMPFTYVTQYKNGTNDAMAHLIEFNLGLFYDFKRKKKE